MRKPLTIISLALLAGCGSVIETENPWNPTVAEQNSYMALVAHSTVNPSMVRFNQAIPFEGITSDGNKRRIICYSINVALSPKHFVYAERTESGWRGPYIGCPSNRVAAALGQF